MSSSSSAKFAHSHISGPWLHAHVRSLGGGWWALVCCPDSGRAAARLVELGATRVSAKGLNVKFQGAEVADYLCSVLVSCPWRPAA